MTKPEIDHDLYKTGDSGIPQSILDGNNEVVLSLCRRCGKGEVNWRVQNARIARK